MKSFNLPEEKRNCRFKLTTHMGVICLIANGLPRMGKPKITRKPKTSPSHRLHCRDAVQFKSHFVCFQFSEMWVLSLIHWIKISYRHRTMHAVRPIHSEKTLKCFHFT